MNKNIDYWEKIVENPSSTYKKLFERENQYLHAHIKPDSVVLDVACGNGRTILSILDITHSITGIDNNAKAIEDASSHLKNYPTVKVIQADGVNLPFKNETFDVAIIMDTLVNFAENKIKVLIEMARIIKNDGIIIISVYSEKALDERLKMYRQIETPIKEVIGSTVMLDESIGGFISEQFSILQLESIVSNAGLKITNLDEVENLSYVATLKRI